ncbi:F390 synthetase-related protein [Emticicia sp. SJ17W-69]|uniref:F390 synthetase-related protein n=1 Tax=Emticicia sp. SJ17W-69 TaxID=3421657 RepID=UPI003EB9DC5C
MLFKLSILYYLAEIKLTKWLYIHNIRFRRNGMIKKMIRHCTTSLFYKPFAQNKHNFENFPVINKAIFMANFDAINTVNIKLEEAFEVAKKSEESRDFSPTISGITVGLSSGTSGNRGVFLASEKERAYWVALILDRVLGFSLKKRSIAFFLRANSNLYDSVKSKLLLFHFFDLLNPLDEHIKRLNALKPSILVAQPSMLIELANAIETNKLKIQPTKVISVAEVLTPEDKCYLASIFKQTIHQVYQCTEGFLASSCENGTLHFNEDFLIIEKKYIDNEQKRFHPIITDLKRQSQPMIRYELNDIIQEKENCSCGSKFLAIEAIEGRSDDILVFKNTKNEEVKIFPDFFRRAIILADSEINDYALIQNEPKYLLLYIKSRQEESYQLAYDAIQNLLKQNNILDIIITQTAHNHTIKGNKLRRIRNDVRKAN